MQPQQKRQNDEAVPTFSDRLLAAALAPLVFNFSVLIVVALISQHSGRLGSFVLSGVMFNGTTIVLIVLPVVVGFLFGTNGLARFLGHSFYTHLESERDIRITSVIWALIFSVAYWVSKAL